MANLSWTMMEFGWSANMFGAKPALLQGYCERVQAIANHVAERTGTEPRTVSSRNYGCQGVFGHLDKDLVMDETEIAMANELEAWLKPQLFKW